MELYPDQVEALDSLRRAYGRGKRRPMLQAPTGYGKTIVGANICQGVMHKGLRVAFVVPFLSLIDQTAERFEQYGIDAEAIGVIQADHWRVDASAPIQICSRDTLSRRGVRPKVDLCIVDEAHVNSQWLFDWMAADPRQKFLGLSATPWTKGLGLHYDDLVIGGRLADLIERGRLSRFEGYAPVDPDLGDVPIVRGEYAEEAAAKVMMGEKLVANVVDTWMERGRGLPTIGFAVNRAHARLMVERFTKAGVRCAYVDAYTPADERADIGRDLAAGRVDIVWNVNCLVAGVDWDVRCAIIARPSRSEMWHVQAIGRALRLAPGKDHAVILDHAGNHLRLGSVTDIHHERLDERKKTKPKEVDEEEEEEKIALPKVCPKCSFLKPAKTPECPVCGFKALQQSDIREGAGKLGRVEGAKGKTPAEKRNARATKEEKQAVISGLLAIQAQKRYKGKWANAKYKAYYGVWPKNLQRIHGPPPEFLKQWLRSENIRYAAKKRKEREGG